MVWNTIYPEEIGYLTVKEKLLYKITKGVQTQKYQLQMQQLKNYDKLTISNRWV